VNVYSRSPGECGDGSDKPWDSLSRKKTCFLEKKMNNSLLNLGGDSLCSSAGLHGELQLGRQKKKIGQNIIDTDAGKH